MDEQELLSSEAAREFLGVSRTTMHRLVQQGEVRRLKVGGQWRFQKADLLAHLERKPVAIAAKSLPELDAELAWWRSEASASGEEEAHSPEEKIAALGRCVLELAIGRLASDVHFEPGSETGRVRLRVDGALETVRQIPMGVFVPLVNRFKELSQMVQDETRVPQDGRILLTHAGQKFDLRLTTCPTTRGESLTMRVLAQAQRLHLDALGWNAEQLAQLRELLNSPSGLLLVCGLMGSGKTTTLHAMLEFLADESRSVVTVEDPAEAALPGVLQTQVDRAARVSVASALRTFLRCDPDIVGIGDLPDLESVELAVQIALSGHLVLAQINVSSAGEATRRLLDMGLEPFLLGASLVGVVTQFLTRRVCADCAQSATPSASVIARLEHIGEREGFSVPVEANWQRGAGCAKCRQTGYRGRFPLYQVVKLNEELAEAIIDGKDARELNTLARESGSRTFWQVGLERAVKGETTPEELLRVLAF